MPTFEPGQQVDVMSGQGAWFPGVVAQVTARAYVVDLTPPVLAATWTGMDRWGPVATLEQVSVWIQAANLPGQARHIRPREP